MAEVLVSVFGRSVFCRREASSIEAPSPEAAKRIADAVNAAFSKAWELENPANPWPFPVGKPIKHEPVMHVAVPPGAVGLSVYRGRRAPDAVSQPYRVLTLAGLERDAWHDGASTCPDKPGVYECRWPVEVGGESVFFNYWTGEAWCWGQTRPGPADADHRVKDRSPMLPIYWRGVTEAQHERIARREEVFRG